MDQLDLVSSTVPTRGGEAEGGKRVEENRRERGEGIIGLISPIAQACNISASRHVSRRFRT